MKKSVLGLGLMLLASVSCGPNINKSDSNGISVDRQDTQIFGGRSAESNSLSKSVVAVYSKAQGGSLCSGVLISEKIILTAAHCLASKLSDIEIIFGPDLNRTQKIKRSAEAAIAHPNYNSKAKQDQKDIGILVLKGELPEGYEAAEILEDASSLRNGDSTHILGYGINWPLPGRQAEKKGAGILRELNLEIENAAYSKTEVSLKQGPFKGGMCSGDSGGPAFIQWNGKKYLWGIGSRARGAFFASCILDSIYTRVDMYGAWIEQVVNDYQSPTE